MSKETQEETWPEGFESLSQMTEVASESQSGEENPPSVYSGVGLVEKTGLEDFKDIREFLYNLMRREGFTDITEVAEFLQVEAGEVEAAIGPKKDLSRNLFLSVVALPFLSKGDADRLMEFILPEAKAEIPIGESVTMEPPETKSGPVARKFGPLPQKRFQWKDESLCRFARYEAKVFDLSKQDERREYSGLITEWRSGMSPFKVVGRQVVFQENDKSVFLELEYYEFLELEG